MAEYKKQMLGINTSKIVEVDDQEFRIRRFSPAQLTVLMMIDDEETEKDPMGVFWIVIMNGLIDDDGAYVYTEDDKETWLNDSDASLSMKLAKEIQSYNGLSDDETDETEAGDPDIKK